MKIPKPMTQGRLLKGKKNKQEIPGNRADGRELTLVNDRKEENTSKNLGKRELEKQKENQGQAKKLDIFVIVYSKIRKCY